MLLLLCILRQRTDEPAVQRQPEIQLSLLIWLGDTVADPIADPDKWSKLVVTSGSKTLARNLSDKFIQALILKKSSE